MAHARAFTLKLGAWKLETQIQSILINHKKLQHCQFCNEIGICWVYYPSCYSIMVRGTSMWLYRCDLNTFETCLSKSSIIEVLLYKNNLNQIYIEREILRYFNTFTARYQ